MFSGEVFPESCVAYELYPCFPENNAIHDVLKATVEECGKLCGTDVANYLWHYDDWTLHPQLIGKGEGSFINEYPGPLSDFVPHLEGMLCFGDNVEDEWFVTWLLFKLTKMIPGLIARRIALFQSSPELGQPVWNEEVRVLGNTGRSISAGRRERASLKGCSLLGVIFSVGTEGIICFGPGGRN
ncbi:unnamed protein product [Notodromas monacha]|uniref:Uncharacterized protein n=1 Tax=Notodromas monacha TaxID=399045 RepID=A0A7R9BIX2_9CRUS|nr:unnamed protein product [Notodromas monacha]CAG0916385.1 unnamed protein product [Notodromas monacha]